MDEAVAVESGQVDWLSSQFLLGDVGAPFIIGIAVGYFAKKALKIALFVGGAAIVATFVFEYFGIIDISDEHLKSAADTAGGAVKSTGGFLMDRLSRITSRGVSATVGFVAGLKLG